MRGIKFIPKKTLKFETQRHKLLLPILSTFFKKRRLTVLPDKEREQRKLQQILERQKWRSKENFF